MDAGAPRPQGETPTSGKKCGKAPPCARGDQKRGRPKSRDRRRIQPCACGPWQRRGVDRHLRARGLKIPPKGPQNYGRLAKSKSSAGQSCTNGDSAWASPKEPVVTQ